MPAPHVHLVLVLADPQEAARCDPARWPTDSQGHFLATPRFQTLPRGAYRYSVMVQGAFENRPKALQLAIGPGLLSEQLDVCLIDHSVRLDQARLASPR